MERKLTLLQTVLTAGVFSSLTFWYGFMFGRESARKELGGLIDDLRRSNAAASDDTTTDARDQRLPCVLLNANNFMSKGWLPYDFHSIKSPNLRITRHPIAQPSVSSRAVNPSAELLLRLWRLRATLDLEADRHRGEQIGRGKTRTRSGSRGGLGEDGEAQEQTSVSNCDILRSMKYRGVEVLKKVRFSKKCDWLLPVDALISFFEKMS
ncbi:hypothetical protein ZIOFF_026283 [Zingiber officinale]|uniref:Uncharacterized protein n=1 Tax=Zingiber officinale TaxID=94328 RepID=A0A8J5H4P7_ZINOF|nr:hypothetical protein ZIOFF_026283 [Zingiber officinale]